MSVVWCFPFVIDSRAHLVVRFEYVAVVIVVAFVVFVVFVVVEAVIGVCHFSMCFVVVRARVVVVRIAGAFGCVVR